MLDVSYKNLIKSGFFLNKRLYKYYKLTFLKFYNLINGISYVTWVRIVYKMEYQMEQSSKCFLKPSEEHFFPLMPINTEFLVYYPSNHNVITVMRYNILKKYLTRSYKGKCHLKGKPVRGQRTWSNRMNARKVNSFLRRYLSTKKKIKLDNWD